MSKLSKLRGGNAAPVAVFSSNATASATAVFDRMQSGKSYSNSKFPEKKKFVPTRYWLKRAESGDIVVLDDQFTFGLREHSVKSFVNGKAVYNPERCISEWDACPLCSQPDAAAYDVAFLSILDLRPWTTKDGKEVKYTKKILAVKKNDLAAFQGLIDVHGSLRGLVLKMNRPDVDKSSSIGSPTFVMKLEQEDLLEEFGHEARLSDKGTVIVPENDSIVPWNYDKYWPVPTRNELAQKYDIAPAPGSREEADQELPWDEEVKVLDLTQMADFPEIND